MFSFKEELTAEEIKNIILEIDAMLQEKPYDEALAWAKKRIEQYPNCKPLLLQIAVIFDARRLVQPFANSAAYDDYFCSLYLCALESEEEEIRMKAADCLVGFYMRKKQYEKAEEYLEYFSLQNPERKRKQALIYSETNRMKEAYKAYEELLFSDYQRASAVLYGMYQLSLKNKDFKKARQMVLKQEELAKCFEMGKHHELSSKLELAILEKDADTAIAIMKELLANVGEIGSFKNAPLYEHLEFQEIKEEFLIKLKENLKKSFRDEKTFGFLKEDKQWQELVK